MRRVLLFAAFLLLLGLTTATAASFDVQAEDITSFSAPVSIDVPSPPLSGVFFLVGGGDSEDIPGSLVPPDPPQASVQTRTIFPSVTGIGDSHLDGGTYHAWQTLPLAAERSIGGSATVTVNFDGVSDQFTAGLFHCSTRFASEAGASIDADLSSADPTVACRLLGSGASTGVLNGMKARSAAFTVQHADLAIDDWVRLKIINHSTNRWRIQWGYNDAREAGLVLS